MFPCINSISWSVLGPGAARRPICQNGRPTYFIFPRYYISKRRAHRIPDSSLVQPECSTNIFLLCIICLVLRYYRKNEDLRTSVSRY